MSVLRIEELQLVGAGRTIQFNRELSIVRGQITTGKTSLLRLLGSVVGGMPSKLPPEFSSISVLRAVVNLGGSTWKVDRPRTSTKTAKVDVTGTELLRLPAQVNDGSADRTYQEWVMDRLGIVRVVVPGRRSDPSFDSSSPVTINDWMNYCLIPGPEIDTMVFGHRNMGVAEKRRWVFDLNYGYYDGGVAALQAELREVERILQASRTQDSTLSTFVEGTALADPDALRRELARALEMRQVASNRSQLGATRAATKSNTEELRTRLLKVRNDLAHARENLRATERQIEDLNNLERQLIAQSRRLTRAIVSADQLLDIEFVVCPRCGQDLIGDHRRIPDDSCRLCLQNLHDDLDNRTSMIAEQDRVEAQIGEVVEVRDDCQSELVSLYEAVDRLVEDSDSLANELDSRTQEFVSDHAQDFELVGEVRATADARVARLRELVGLADRRQALIDKASAAQARKEEIEEELDGYQIDHALADALVYAVEERMLEYLRRLDPPVLEGDLTVRIDPVTKLPIVSGRSFDSLSSQGLCVLVNIAHALAHHTVSADADLQLPGLLALDGISSNVGREGWDAEREENAFRLLADVAREYQDKLQIIVFDNNTPSWLEDSIVLDLTQEDRLVRD